MSKLTFLSRAQHARKIKFWDYVIFSLITAGVLVAAQNKFSAAVSACVVMILVVLWMMCESEKSGLKEPGADDLENLVNLMKDNQVPELFAAVQRALANDCVLTRRNYLHIHDACKQSNVAARAAAAKQALQSYPLPGARHE